MAKGGVRVFDVRWLVWWRDTLCGTVQYSTVQYSTAQHSTAQHSTVQYSTVQYSTVQYSTVQYSTVQYSTVQYSTVQYSTVNMRSQHDEWQRRQASLPLPPAWVYQRSEAHRAPEIWVCEITEEGTLSQHPSCNCAS